mgnify:CR=1 FL=1
MKELQDAGIDPEEEEELLNKEKRYKSAEKYITTLSSAIDLYEKDQGIKEQLSILIRMLNLEDDIINSVKEHLEDLYYNLNDETETLKELLSGFSDEDLNIEYIEERLYQYSRLKRKHSCDSKGLLELENKLKEKIALYDDREYILSQKKAELDALYKQAYEKAQKLHESRLKQAKLLEKQVETQAKQLMLPNTVFEIVFEKTDLKNNGIDEVEFYVSTNKGELPKPLKNAASGGEISRLMLALKAVFTSLSNTSLVIFDEIDTGVSGKVALAIGRKIARIGQTRQVLCISHLAAVAACAKEHFFIYKSDETGYSNTSVKKLNEDEIIRELAIISTSEVSDAALDAAKQLYESAQNAINQNET